MAYKSGNDFTLETDITFTLGDVAERGVVVVYGTAGSGVGLGDTAGEVTLSASASGTVPAGMLDNDMVSIDETRYHRNFSKREMKIGENCTLLKKGRRTTNKLTGTPTPGATAYLTANGVLTPTLSATGGLVATPKVGQFVTGKDEDGYATVDIQLPA